MRPYLVNPDKQRFIDIRFIFLTFVMVGFPFSVCGWLNNINQSEWDRKYEITKSFVGTDTVNVIFTAKAELDMTAYPPTVTPFPTSTVTLTPEPVGVGLYPVMNFYLSFYDPAIGKYFPEIAQVNCLEWDDVLQDCVSKVNNGTEHYFVYYRRGVACPPPLRDGQRLRVVSPVELRSISEEWICIDRGGAIHNYWMDFMLKYPDDIWTGDNLDNFPWGSEVKVEVLP